MTASRIFVLDTNVLMHDPTAMFRFDEHDVYIPMVVLEELDRGKKGLSEAARNARQASRFLDDLLRDHDKAAIDRGIQLPGQFRRNGDEMVSAGRLFFQTTTQRAALPDTLAGNIPDNNVLGTTLATQNEHATAQVTLVSKDINLRIKAAVLGIHAEDYFNDKTLDDVDLLFCGFTELAEDFWESHSKDIDAWKEDGRTFYKISGADVANWVPGQFVYTTDGSAFEATVRSTDDEDAVVEVVTDYTSDSHDVWGIRARNREQNYVLNLLLDDDIDLVTILGAAGTGKTLLALAAGLRQTLDDNRYKEIIMTRVTVPLGEDIGFLPGTEEEKMEPWMGALMDNLEVLNHGEDVGSWGRDATHDLIRNRIKIRSLNFMRGRTFFNRYIIVDEAQNLTAKQMKALITRAGPGTKLVVAGNVAQIDTPYLTETTSGLTYVVNRFKSWAHSGHITLLQGERSRLADHAAELL
ncbi:MAG: PhoH family protein [Gammaproteobacteria bacterium]|nr:PhoH family protein [Gammaproteobacteria bacterium]